MTTPMTFAALQNTVAATIGRDDLTTRIVDFIASAEFRIAREVRARGFKRYSTSTLTAGSAGAIIDLPVRLLDGIAIHILADSTGLLTGSIRNVVLERSYSFILAYTPNRATTGLPRFWALMNNDQVILAPSPVVAYPFELAYYERLAPLSAGNTTNWLTDNAPRLLLYATLLEAAPYLRDDTRVPTWQAFYDREAAAITSVEHDSDTDDASKSAA